MPGSCGASPRHPGARLQDIAASLGISEHSAYAITTDLTEADYIAKPWVGRATATDPGTPPTARTRRPGAQRRRVDAPCLGAWPLTCWDGARRRAAVVSLTRPRMARFRSASLPMGATLTARTLSRSG